jgi:hypothetical protein
MDNQVKHFIKKILTKEECRLQLVEPHNHCVNAAKHAIQMYKDAFVVVFATTDSNFPTAIVGQTHAASSKHP